MGREEEVDGWEKEEGRRRSRPIQDCKVAVKATEEEEVRIEYISGLCSNSSHPLCPCRKAEEENEVELRRSIWSELWLLFLGGEQRSIP